MTLQLDQFKVLTFDVVGTLIDFEKGILDSVRRLGGSKAQALSDDEIFGPYLEGRDKYAGRSSQAMRDVYVHLANKLGLPADADTADAFQIDVLRWPAFEDSVEALRRLRKHYRLVAMTNADRVAYTSYAHTLGNPFHDGVTCDETSVAKPDARFFSYNLGRQGAFGYQQAEILHVAQSQYHDIGVARDEGYAVCWIERRHDVQGFGGTPEPASMTTPDLHFTSLRELADAADAAHQA